MLSLYLSAMYTYPMLSISMLYSQMEMKTTKRMSTLSSKRGRLMNNLLGLFASVTETRTKVFSMRQVAVSL